MSVGGFIKRFMPMEVYPLVAAVGVGCSLSVYAIHHHLANNPDVNIKTTDYSWERFDKKTMRPHFDFLEGKKHNNHKAAFVAEQVAAGKM